MRIIPILIFPGGLLLLSFIFYVSSRVDREEGSYLEKLFGICNLLALWSIGVTLIFIAAK